MPSHRLILDKARRAGEWVLEWDDIVMRVTAPDGQLMFAIPVSQAHRVIDLYELDAEGKISFATDSGAIRFRRNKGAAADVRALIIDALRSDAAFRAAQKRQARRVIPIGIAAFVIGGGIFTLYCIWASRTPDPPRGHWIYYFGWIIHLVLLVMLAAALAGPYLVFRMLRQLRRVRRVERALASEASAE